MIGRIVRLVAVLALGLIPGLALGVTPGPASGAARAQDASGGAQVAVAADFAGAAAAIVAAFQAQTGRRLSLTVAPTAKLRTQSLEGAPFDVILSGDARTPEELEGVGLVVPRSRFTYATGRLALWRPQGAGRDSDPVAALSDPAVRTVAIPDPRRGPYGAAAREALEALGLWDRLQPKLVTGRDIEETYALVNRGAADLGLVAASALRGPAAPKTGLVLPIPREDYGLVRHDAALMTHGRDNATAKAFLTFLKSDAAHAIAARFGFGAA